jgi:ATP/maltotriose-dependent transcriptional regulator MalT
VAALFRDQYRVFLTPEEVHELTAETEGWAIALQLVWQGLRTGLASDLPQALVLQRYFYHKPSNRSKVRFR